MSAAPIPLPDAPQADAPQPACAVGPARERMMAVPARSERLSLELSLELDLPLDLEGSAVVPGPGELRAIADGNRSVVLPDVRAIYAGREWMLSVKGAGASTPAYDAFPASLRSGELEGRVIGAEAWMGDAPYGGQGELGAFDALAITALAGGAASLEGVCICPVVRVVEVPEAHVRRDCFWYRRWRGRVVQEHRLVPSDVRLFHGSEAALGRDAERALSALGVRDVPALDAFAERYLRTGVAALTLWARTAREHEGGWEGLEYDDAWLDKDSVIASDGALHLVDLEALEWTPATSRMPARRRIERQINRNFYELAYGLDAILDVRAGWLERDETRAARRASVAARLELALAGDPWVSVVDRGEGIDLEVRAPGGDEDVVVRVLDRR